VFHNPAMVAAARAGGWAALHCRPVAALSAMSDPHHRPLEAVITTDLRERLSYAGYLHLDVLLAAQKPRSGADNADELLFIIQH